MVESNVINRYKKKERRVGQNNVRRSAPMQQKKGEDRNFFLPNAPTDTIAQRNAKIEKEFILLTPNGRFFVERRRKR